MQLSSDIRYIQEVYGDVAFLKGILRNPEKHIEYVRSGYFASAFDIRRPGNNCILKIISNPLLHQQIKQEPAPWGSMNEAQARELARQILVYAELLEKAGILTARPDIVAIDRNRHPHEHEPLEDEWCVITVQKHCGMDDEAWMRCNRKSTEEFFAQCRLRMAHVLTNVTRLIECPKPPGFGLFNLEFGYDPKSSNTAGGLSIDHAPAHIRVKGEPILMIPQPKFDWAWKLAFERTFTIPGMIKTWLCSNAMADLDLYPELIEQMRVVCGLYPVLSPYLLDHPAMGIDELGSRQILRRINEVASDDQYGLRWCGLALASRSVRRAPEKRELWQKGLGFLFQFTSYRDVERDVNARAERARTIIRGMYEIYGGG